MRVIDCHVARATPEGDIARATSDGWEYLVLRRSPGRLDAGRWRVVTGKIEDGETAWEAAQRELFEETGLEPQRLLAVPYVNQFYEWEHDRINAIPVFLAVVDREAPITLDDEHVEAAWFDLETATGQLAWPGQREGLRAAAALLAEDRGPVEALEIDLSARSGD